MKALFVQKTLRAGRHWNSSQPHVSSQNVCLSVKHRLKSRATCSHWSSPGVCGDLVDQLEQMSKRWVDTHLNNLYSNTDSSQYANNVDHNSGSHKSFQANAEISTTPCSPRWWIRQTPDWEFSCLNTQPSSAAEKLTLRFEGQNLLTPKLMNHSQLLECVGHWVKVCFRFMRQLNLLPSYRFQVRCTVVWWVISVALAPSVGRWE